MVQVCYNLGMWTDGYLHQIYYFFSCPKSSKSAKKIFFMQGGGQLVLVLMNFFVKYFLSLWLVFTSEKKIFFLSKILFLKHAKNIKKIAFCTPNGVGRQTDGGCNNVTQIFFFLFETFPYGTVRAQMTPRPPYFIDAVSCRPYQPYNHPTSSWEPKKP